MKNILVPVGTVDKGITNLQYAVNLAAMSGATVYLVSMYKEFSKVGTLTKVNQLIVEDTEAQLQEVLDGVDTKGVKVITRPIKGDVYEGVKRINNAMKIDLMILSPQSIEIKDEVYLGPITGKLVKQTEVPVLIVPKEYIFRKANTILLAFKNGTFDNPKVLTPLKEIASLFSSKVNVLHVRTPGMQEAEEPIDPEIDALKDQYTETENATIFQGVLEHFQSNSPDMLCVLRRKRGFFEKLWEKNAVLKKEFHTSKPLLILRGQD
ncbi:universal stress protein [Altibacter sp. HG106]|uniref:universal stress protein n=1 Tax=Altibacter sp. HG106 TaxID=3023937 RepID=UPI00234FD9B8|nr:universal stress protein [Altibacter sp. HG106]MDC7994920.1 universal stress protein [Altibacter sp. HG106]